MNERYEIDGLSYEEIDWDRYYAQEDADQAAWNEYWNGLSDEQRARELRMMNEYVEECRREREARGGFDV